MARVPQEVPLGLRFRGGWSISWVGRPQRQKPTHVPLLNLLKTSAQLPPSTARRLARVLRTHSITQPSGFTYFHRSGFLLPMVVSSVTCGGPRGRCAEGPPDVRMTGPAATSGSAAPVAVHTVTI